MRTLIFWGLSVWAALAAERPNIVLIMADDLGFADLGCYGSEIETPTLDKLAGEGLRFTRFYNTAKCHSSRVCLLTGLWCDQAGSEKLSRGATLAEVLKPAGYHTMMVGKWHLSKSPTDFGFDRYWGHLSGATDFFAGDKTFRLDTEPWKVPAELNGKRFYTTEANVDFAIDFLKDRRASEKKADPFFLYVAFNAPHYPLQAPKADVEKYMGRYDAGWDKLRAARHDRQLKSGLLPEKWKLSPRPDHVPAWEELSDETKAWESKRMAVFAAMVDVMDRNIGRLVEDLKQHGEWDNTIFLFCSDNGACPFERTWGGDREPWEANTHWTYDTGWAHVGNTPFRLYKQNQHEGGISSPLIAHWPAGMATGGKAFRSIAGGAKVTDQPGHLVDFMATVIDVAGAKYPETVGDRKIDPLQGKSLLPVLRGETREPHESLYFHFGAGDRALVQGEWKAVSAKRSKWELYNLTDDRTELNDLAGQEPKRLRRMIDEWFRLAEEVDRLPPAQLKPASGKPPELKFERMKKPPGY
jgi:arylsulfatase